ncbi:hypothetical protein M438DRAFT_358289 [Aureobasidium pullulans EXF-150]|uniref:PBP domain-containing protein n=1 Tax=Aureobasidium pullulans EXF-150 TaxID=1043002 RepID=A0A074XB64_AURPU|nr:uncharacterized protein M438DRAFT_358289 [Aureobasidium pullulans EXF-150]KEQ80969.1 hypothetical protein M438DRAFT_358289 [Aureobasidium pullulans EXF-150]
MTSQNTAIVSHGTVETQPSQIYGSGTPILRIGNGGAGATGLVEALANDYLSTTSTHGSIHWICNHSRNTQLALLGGHIDLALTYERDQEALAALEGWSVTAGYAFHDHFCLLGPENDPADIRSSTHIGDAFARIAKTRSLFHSRVDASATMWKERSLWGLVDPKPWDDSEAETWYKTSTSGPAEALTNADAAGAYLLSDRSTLLRQTMLRAISKSTVFYEPMGPKDILINSCYALYSPRLPIRIHHEVHQFLKYLNSARGQAVISRFGENEVGVPFFACVEDGFAKTSLLNGRASGGRWVFKTLDLPKARL